MAMESARVGAIGLGLLGSALVERLVRAGHRVEVYNRSREKAEPLIEMGAVWSDNPLALCDVVVVCLYTTDVVRDVLANLGDMRPGLTLIDTTTGDPDGTERLGRDLEQKQVDYLECPIAASSAQTLRGEALAMVGGKREVFERYRDLIALMAPKSFHVGPWGNGARMKLVNNLILGLTRAALAEGLAFADAIGIAKQDALPVLREGNAYSVVMDVKGMKMVNDDFTTQAKLSQHLKDVRLMLAEAEKVGIELPLSKLHRDLLAMLEAEGFGELDNCAILKAFGTDRES